MAAQRCSPAERHKAEVQAGLRLDIFGLGELVKRGERAAWQGSWPEAAQAFRSAKLFAELLLGADHIWTAILAGKLARAIEARAPRATSGTSSCPALLSQDEGAEASALWQEARKVCFGRQRQRRASNAKRKRQPRSLARRAALQISLEDFRVGEAARRGADAAPRVIDLQDLTPRSRHACAAAGVDPALLQERDAHSFYARGRTFAAQRELLRRHKARRAQLLDDLLQDREVVRLADESKQRLEEFETRVAREAEAREKRRLAARGGVHGLEALTRGSILQPAEKSSPYRGARAALTAYAYEKELCCPGCRLVWDLQSRVCGRCKRVLDFADTHVLPINPQPVPSCFPAMQGRAAEGVRRPPESLSELRRQARGLRQRGVSERSLALPATAGWAARLAAARQTRVDLAESLFLHVQAANHLEAQLCRAAPDGKPDPALLRTLRKGVRAQVLDFTLAAEEVDLGNILRETRLVASKS